MKRKNYKKKTLKKKRKCSENNFRNQLKNKFIIDSHIHYLFKNDHKNIILKKNDNEDYEKLPKIYPHNEFDKLLMNTQWKPAAIIPCTIQPTDFFFKVKETALILNLAKKNKLIIAYQANIPINLGKLGVEIFFNSLKKMKVNNIKLIKVARILLTPESIFSFDYKYVDENLFQEGLEELGKRNIIWKWNSTKVHWKSIKKLTMRCKKTKFIIDHLLLTSDTTKLDYKLWKNTMIELSKLKNIVGVDISGINQWKYRGLNDDDIEQLIKDSIEIFGVSKIIVGSNNPVDDFFFRKINSRKISKKKIYDNLFDNLLNIFFDLNVSSYDICNIFRNNSIKIFKLSMEIKYII